MIKNINRKPFTFYIWLGGANVALWLFQSFVEGLPDAFLRRCVNIIWLNIYLVVINYILFEYTLPFIKFTWKRLLIAPVLLFLHFLAYSVGFYIWRRIGIELHLYAELKKHASVEEGITYHLPTAISSVLFFAVLEFIYDYRKLKSSTQKLRIEKQEAELNYLKSQTNPHFLFNTLNNIYSLARDKSDLAPESIMKLSKILRYMLYEAGGQYIAIEQEIKIMNDYIALEKLRYDETLHINFNYDIEDMKQALPPLLLIPLVENAFKHGVSETRHRPFVDIHISVNKRQLVFIVKNSVESVMEEHGVKENIGLSNLRRQLELLYKEYSL